MTPQFDLYEVLLWRPDGGYRMLEAHLDRLAGSADYFDRPVDRDVAHHALLTYATTLEQESKVRMMIQADGAIRVESIIITPYPRHITVGLATEPIDPNNPFLYYKTTRRDVYNKAKASRPDCDDVLLWNEHGEITEASSSNVVFEINGRKVTPPVASGLLNGTFRRSLLESAEISEQVVTIAQAKSATQIWLINSVRGWRSATLR